MTIATALAVSVASVSAMPLMADDEERAGQAGEHDPGRAGRRRSPPPSARSATEGVFFSANGDIGYGRRGLRRARAALPAVGEKRRVQSINDVELRDHRRLRVSPASVACSSIRARSPLVTVVKSPPTSEPEQHLERVIQPKCHDRRSRSASSQNIEAIASRASSSQCAIPSHRCPCPSPATIDSNSGLDRSVPQASSRTEVGWQCVAVLGSSRSAP